MVTGRFSIFWDNSAPLRTTVSRPFSKRRIWDPKGLTLPLQTSGRDDLHWQSFPSCPRNVGSTFPTISRVACLQGDTSTCTPCLPSNQLHSAQLSSFLMVRIPAACDGGSNHRLKSAHQSNFPSPTFHLFSSCFLVSFSTLRALCLERRRHEILTPSFTPSSGAQLTTVITAIKKRGIIG